MKVRPNEADWALARSVYSEFKAKPESQHIATEFALAHLSAILSEHEINSVLEVGSGIGTMTALLIRHPKAPQTIVTVEGHPVCIAEFGKNIPQSGGLVLVNQLEDAPEQAYDLVLLDGEIGNSRQYDRLKNGSVCFVEGNRKNMRASLLAYFQAKGGRIDFTNHKQGLSVKLGRSRRFKGLPIPSLRVGRKKGCVVGRLQLN